MHSILFGIDKYDVESEFSEIYWNGTDPISCEY